MKRALRGGCWPAAWTVSGVVNARTEMMVIKTNRQKFETMDVIGRLLSEILKFDEKKNVREQMPPAMAGLDNPHQG